MRCLWWAWCLGCVLVLSGCGDKCNLTTAPVVEQDDDDDRDEDEGRDTLRVGGGWPDWPPRR